MTWAKKRHGSTKLCTEEFQVPECRMPSGIATAAMDLEKYFDRTCWEVTFQMLDRMGLDQRIWKPMLNFIAHLKRFNKVAGTLDPRGLARTA